VRRLWIKNLIKITKALVILIKFLIEF
jgi:hypothetical protein